MEENRNMAVQAREVEIDRIESEAACVKAFRRRGDTEEKRKRYDWLPWEDGLERESKVHVNKWVTLGLGFGIWTL